MANKDYRFMAAIALIGFFAGCYVTSSMVIAGTQMMNPCFNFCKSWEKK